MVAVATAFLMKEIPLRKTMGPEVVAAEATIPGAGLEIEGPVGQPGPAGASAASAAMSSGRPRVAPTDT